MKKSLFCILSALSITSLSITAVHANELSNFDELKNAIQQGQSINIVAHLNECQPTINNLRLPAVITGAHRPSSFMIVNDQISASNLHFTRNDPNFPDRSVFEFVTYNFSADNKMTLTAQILDATNYSPFGQALRVTCSVGSSVKLFS